MNPEEEALRAVLETNDDDPPPSFARTVIGRWPSNMSPRLEVLRRVWTCVATWGTWQDEALGKFPSVERALAELPPWFARGRMEPEFWETWLGDLHDREWWWWSSRVRGEAIVVQITADSMPMTVAPLWFAMELLGASDLEVLDL